MLTERNDNSEKKEKDLNAALQNKVQKNSCTSSAVNTTTVNNPIVELEVREETISEQSSSIFNFDKNDIVIPFSNSASTSNSAFDAALLEDNSTRILHAIVNMNQDPQENELIYMHEFDLELIPKTFDFSPTKALFDRLPQVPSENKIPTDYLALYEKDGWLLLKDNAYGL